jgi:hypothetical protein
LIHGEGDVDAEAERVVWDLFMGNNADRSVEDVDPQNMKPIPPQGYVPSGADDQLELAF